MSGVYMIPVSSAVRQSAGPKGGDPIRVIVRLDSQPRVVAVPLDFEQALKANPGAKAFFGFLSPSGKNKYVGLLYGAKLAETRQKRVDKAISDLGEAKK
ncbi:YdeI/OmpD-associated family protein [Spirosoma sp. RP8]|uniref:YdeI/OmpD-associated family protein n=1 Tax=Spirosoma liriopis TaxID=2937440 RepID=A0ABT0HTS4_9BACT|nr:YdeI/OmpD-associated family protein [Spirosoma liriopis]MCK8495232.1 YdeI/OmpD-associated family protein [Spirosoma liriopis]